MILLILVIIIFSIVQSIFGVGLLVFGTPSLVLSGKSYEEALSLLLPCSLVISLCQVLTAKVVVKSFKRRFVMITLPMVVGGLYLVLEYGVHFSLFKLLGLILVFTALIRLNRKMHVYFVAIFKKFSNVYLAILGLVHGMTNLGGGLLTIYSSTIVEGKNESRSIVSYAYMVFSIIQISVLVILKKFIFIKLIILLVVLSLFCFFMVGQKIYIKTPDLFYQKSLSWLIFGYGVILLLR